MFRELNEVHGEGCTLFEGAKGICWDVQYGTYPYVTSSNRVAGNAAAELAYIPACLLCFCITIYCTRGVGPFPARSWIGKWQSGYRYEHCWCRKGCDDRS